MPELTPDIPLKKKKKKAKKKGKSESLSNLYVLARTEKSQDIYPPWRITSKGKDTMYCNLHLSLSHHRSRVISTVCMPSSIISGPIKAKQPCNNYLLVI